MTPRTDRRAAALIIALAILAALAIMGTTFVRLAAVERKAAAAHKDHVHARMFAEGAVRFAIGRLAADGLLPTGSIDEAWVYEPGGEGRGGREPGLEVPIVDSLRPSYAQGVTTPRGGREFGYSYSAPLPRGLTGYATLRVLDTSSRIDVNAGDVGLARMLETLGALTDPANPPIDAACAARTAAARAAEPGGRFGSLEDFARALELPDGALERVGQFLVAWGPGEDALVPAPERWPDDGAKVARLAPPGEATERRAAIDINHAPYEVLVSLFAHVSARALDPAAQDGRSRGRAATTPPVTLDLAKSLARALVRERDPQGGGAGPLAGRADLAAFLARHVGTELAADQAAALLANLAPDARLVGAGGPIDWPAVSKADLVGRTTEAAFGVSGGFEITALARIVHGDRLVADELVEVDVDLLELVRVTGQAELGTGTLERLTSYPECPALPPATVFGAVGPSPLAAPSDPSASLVASLAGRVDPERGGAPPGEPDGARLLALSRGDTAGEIHPDAVYSDGVHVPAWPAASALDGTRGQVAVWFSLDRRLASATGPLYLPLTSVSYLRPDAPPPAPDAPSYSSARTVRFALWLVVPGVGADAAEQARALAARKAELARALADARAAGDLPLERALTTALAELAQAERQGGTLATADARPLLALMVEGADGDSELVQLARGDAVAAALRTPGWHHLAFHWDLSPHVAYEDALGIALDGAMVTEGQGPPRGYERLELELVQLAPPALATSGQWLRLGEWSGRGFEPFDDHPFCQFAALEVHRAPLAARDLARRYGAGRYDPAAARYESPVLWPGASAVRWVRVHADVALEIALVGTDGTGVAVAPRTLEPDGRASDASLTDPRVAITWRTAAGSRLTRELVTGLEAARLRVPERIRRWQIGGTRLREFVSPEDVQGPPVAAPTASTALPDPEPLTRPPGPPTLRASPRATWVAPLPFDLEILARDGGSRPLEGARATLTAGARTEEATTDDAGRAVFTAVPAGTVSVVLAKPGHRGKLLRVTSPGGSRALVVASLAPDATTDAPDRLDDDPGEPAIPAPTEARLALAPLVGELKGTIARTRAGTEVVLYLDTPVPDLALNLVSAAPGRPVVLPGRRNGRYLTFGPFTGALPPGRLLVRMGDRDWLLVRDDHGDDPAPVARARDAGTKLVARLQALERAHAAIVPELAGLAGAQRPAVLRARLAAWRQGHVELEQGLAELVRDYVAPPLGGFARDVERAAAALATRLVDLEASILGLPVPPRSGPPPVGPTAAQLERDLARAAWALGGDAATSPALGPPHGDASPGTVVARFAAADRLHRLVCALDACAAELATLAPETRARGWPVLAAAWQAGWDGLAPAAHATLAAEADARYGALADWIVGTGPRPADDWAKIATARLAATGLSAAPRLWARELVDGAALDVRPRALSGRLAELDALVRAVPGNPPIADLPGFATALRAAIARLAVEGDANGAQRDLDRARRAIE